MLHARKQAWVWSESDETCQPSGTRVSTWQTSLSTTVLQLMWWPINEDLAWVTMPSTSMSGECWDSCEMCWRYASCCNIVTTLQLTNQILGPQGCDPVFLSWYAQPLPWLSQLWTMLMRSSPPACLIITTSIQQFAPQSDSPRTPSINIIPLLIPPKSIALRWVSNSLNEFYY